VRIHIRESIAILFLIARLSSAQQHSTRDCQFDGLSANPKLAETVASSVAYYGCGANRDCLSKKLQQGEPVVVFSQSAEWICGYVEDNNGATPAWVPARDLRELKPDPNPSLAAWFGMWSQSDDRIQIQPARDPSKVHLTGHATWHGARGVKHYGELEGEAIHSGNHFHYSEGPDACTVDLTLFGKYIVADDNERCGGMNVRFWGLWTRARK
jgi:hypothetical protein